MCVFCAAIPATAAAGAALQGKQREAARQAEGEGRPSPVSKVPVAKATTALIATLVIASVIYHTQLRI
jgi:hypothetical protein